MMDSYPLLVWLSFLKFSHQGCSPFTRWTASFRIWRGKKARTNKIPVLGGLPCLFQHFRSQQMKHHYVISSSSKAPRTSVQPYNFKKKGKEECTWAKFCRKSQEAKILEEISKVVQHHFFMKRKEKTWKQDLWSDDLLEMIIYIFISLFISQSSNSG